MRSMSTTAFITCAVTGSGDTTGSSDKVPVTPEQIAESAIEAAKAGAAVVHIHVRNPRRARAPATPRLYREVVERIRASDTDVVINLTPAWVATSCWAAPRQPLPHERRRHRHGRRDRAAGARRRAAARRSARSTAAR